MTPTPTTSITPTPCSGIQFDFLFGGSGQEGICFGTFEPFRGISSMGLFSTLAFLFNIIFIILFLIWVITMGLAVLDYIRSQDNPDLIETGKNRFLNIWRGITVGLLAFVIAAVLGTLLGAGSPFEWSKNLAQCGPERELYLNYKEDITREYVGTTTSIPVYCCPDLGWSEGVAAGEQNCELWDTVAIPEEEP